MTTTILSQFQRLITLKADSEGVQDCIEAADVRKILHKVIQWPKNELILILHSNNWVLRLILLIYVLSARQKVKFGVIFDNDAKWVLKDAFICAIHYLDHPVWLYLIFVIEYVIFEGSPVTGKQTRKPVENFRINREKCGLRIDQKQLWYDLKLINLKEKQNTPKWLKMSNFSDNDDNFIKFDKDLLTVT